MNLDASNCAVTLPSSKEASWDDFLQAVPGK
jgi:hypothetical protein